MSVGDRDTKPAPTTKALIEATRRAILSRIKANDAPAAETFAHILERLEHQERLEALRTGIHTAKASQDPTRRE